MKFIKKYWLFILLLLMLTLIIFPLIISYLITAGEWLAWFEGTSNVWIGFWGSYLGGVVGTAGVIYVAHLQNSKQQEQNEQMMKWQSKDSDKQIEAQINSMYRVEQYNRERLRIETQIKLLENHTIKVKKLYEDILFLRVKLIRLVNNRKLANQLKMLDDNDQKLEEEFISLKEIFSNYNSGYVKNISQDILYLNSVLYHEDVQLELPEYDAPQAVDKMLDLINSPLKEFDVEELERQFGTKKKNNKIKYDDLDKCAKWLSDELSSTHKSISKLIKKLDIDIINGQ